MSKSSQRAVLGLAAPLAVVAAAALAALAASAPGTPAANQSTDVGPGYGYGYGYGMGPGMMGGFGAWGVNPPLSDAQRIRIEGIDKASLQQQRVLMQSMHKLVFESRPSRAGGPLDVDAIMKRASAMSDLRLRMLRNRLEAASRFDAVLTPRQRESLGAARRARRCRAAGLHGGLRPACRLAGAGRGPLPRPAARGFRSP